MKGSGQIISEGHLAAIIGEKPGIKSRPVMGYDDSHTGGGCERITLHMIDDELVSRELIFSSDMLISLIPPSVDADEFLPQCFMTCHEPLSMSMNREPIEALRALNPSDLHNSIDFDRSSG
jgi:hypothetical protein